MKTMSEIFAVESSFDLVRCLEGVFVCRRIWISGGACSSKSPLLRGSNSWHSSEVGERVRLT